MNLIYQNLIDNLTYNKTNGSLFFETFVSAETPQINIRNKYINCHHFRNRISSYIQ
jgi:hypothetical protein